MDKKARRTLLMMRLGIQFTIALVLSLVMTAVNYGFTGTFMHHWAKGFIVAFIIIPPALRLIPGISRGVQAVMGNCTLFALRCVVTLCIASMMEGLIALVVTLAQHGLAAGWALVWATTFVKAFPLGLAIGATMTFIVQPRMQRLALSAQTR